MITKLNIRNRILLLLGIFSVLGCIIFGIMIYACNNVRMQAIQELQAIAADQSTAIPPGTINHLATKLDSFIYNETVLIAGILLGILVVFVLPSGFFIYKSISLPLLRLRELSEDVAQGKLDVEFNQGGTDELSRMESSLAKMVLTLKERLAFSEGLLKGIPYPCAVFDNNNRATYINDNMLELMEAQGRREQLLGKTSGEVLVRDSNRVTLTQKAVEQKKRINGEIDYETYKLNMRKLDVTASPIPGHDDEMLGVVLFWFDLTEIRHNEQQVHKNYEEMQHIANEADTIAHTLAESSQVLSAQIEQSGSGALKQRHQTADAAAAMEQMNASVLEIARNAANAAEQATVANEKGAKGAEIVQKVVEQSASVQKRTTTLKEAMSALGEQASSIGKILQVIEDIADQTNLLALNAAIEAARAGDAGRGFAVVADEVRKLAEKTMVATHEVTSAIGDMQSKATSSVDMTLETATIVQSSTALAEESGKALAEIVDSISKTNMEIQTIAAATEQQSATSEQITRSVEELDRISHETSEAMAHSESAVRQISELANSLEKITTQLRNR